MPTSAMAAIASSIAVVAARAGCSGRNKQEAALSSCFAGPGLGKRAMVAMQERGDHRAVLCSYTREKVVATLKDATSEAIRDWRTNMETTLDFGVAGAKFCRLGATVMAPDEPVSKAGGRIEISRRNLFTAAFAAAATALPLVRTSPASATSFRRYDDRFDGYSFSYPEGWIQVRGAGADVFFRDPVNLDENVVVEFSSPSSSRYESVEDLGTPEEAAQRILKQYLTEFMSTRIGVRRESNIMSSKSRIGDDGRLYYDIEVNVKSYANTNQLAVMPENRVAKLEWSRRYLSVLGVENKRLYELRLQTPERVLLEEEPDLRQMMNSFQLVKIDA